MPIIVQKFGGTSVGNIERIKHVAALVLKEKAKGNTPVVVVSAMAGFTDQLVEYAKAISNLTAFTDVQEYDVTLASGEQITAALLALALHERDCKARSWLGWQLPIHTDGTFGNAKIKQIDTAPLLEALDNGVIPVISGFQGIHQGRVTTLGRGGSDTTAAAVAAALKAERCDIYTDVTGVFSADPRLVPNARKLKQLSFEEMLELSSSGAKVLHSRSVEMAMRYNLKMQVLSSFSDEPGTMLVSEEELMEENIVTGIVCSADEICVTLSGLSKTANATAQVFAAVAQGNVSIDMIVQNTHDGEITLSFTVTAFDSEKTEAALASLKGELFAEMQLSPIVSQVSVVGVGMRRHTGTAKRMFEILAQQNIEVLAISTSEIKISALIPKDKKEFAVRALHTGFDLDI
ncbi:MAG: aspartate kinase [Proteobacteria bacterium]|nr:aspartate kinase [Pseudomonadota bacterium]